MIIVLALLLLANVAVLACLVAGGLYVRRQAASFRDFVSPSTTPEGQPGPSALSQITDAVATQFSRAITMQFKATFMGQQSASKGQERAVQGALLEDGLAAIHPMAGALLQSFPALSKTLKRNPQLLDLVLSRFAGGASMPGTGPVPSGNGSDSHYKITS